MLFRRMVSAFELVHLMGVVDPEEYISSPILRKHVWSGAAGRSANFLSRLPRQKTVTQGGQPNRQTLQIWPLIDPFRGRGSPHPPLLPSAALALCKPKSIIVAQKTGVLSDVVMATTNGGRRRWRRNLRRCPSPL